MREAFKQKSVGCLMMGGFVIASISGVCALVFSMGGVFRGTFTRAPVTNEITDAGTLNLVPLCILFLAVGVAMMLGGVGYGVWVVANEKNGRRVTIEHFRVLARYVYDGPQMLVAEYEIEAAQRPRFYVRAMLPSGETLEYETDAPVYFNCGEGMLGQAEVQGKWLGMFVPYIGSPA